MKYNIVTIEREFASGGRIIGKMLAESLGIPYYGTEILQMVADKYNVSREMLEDIEERATSNLSLSLSMMSTKSLTEGFDLSLEGKLYIAEAKIIRDLCLKGPTVIIGHCASHILKDRSDILNVFIHSDWDSRRKRAIEEYGINEQNADTVLRKFDRRRSNFFNANTGKQWNDIKNYHMVLDSSKLGLEMCTKILTNSISI